MQHEREPMSAPQGGAVPPVIGADVPAGKPTGRGWLAILLSVGLGAFLVDALISFLDDTVILWFHLHLLAGIRALVFLFAFVLTVVIWFLMGITPVIPKRVFLPMALFTPVTVIAYVPLSALFYDRIQQVAWMVSLTQLLVAAGLILWVKRGEKWRWPLVPENLLRGRFFSWLNLSGYAFVHLFVLLPGALLAVYLGVGFAIHDLSEGFVKLRPAGMVVEVREYVRDDGKSVLLVPMSHIGESEFYRNLTQVFPTNAVVLMEGVTDDQGLLTNRITYERVAESLGLVEQEVEFDPNPAMTMLVHADLDVAEFSPMTIDFINMVMLGHSKGLTPEFLAALGRYKPPPGFEYQLFDDLLGKRNQHLLTELHLRIDETENVVVPWGAAHMPGIARGLTEAGFSVADSWEHVAIRFGAGPSPSMDQNLKSH